MGCGAKTTRFLWLPTVIALVLAATASAAGVDVATYHNDTLRTGWNSAEISLTSNAVASPKFALLKQVVLDDLVAAQPLLVTGLTIEGAAHDVVYVATESNSIYAIDASSGAILLRTSLGTPGAPNVTCNSTGKTVGINSTPVIDLSSHTLYVIAYVNVGGTQDFYLHALDLTSLADTLPPVMVSVSHTLSNGKTVYSFSAGEELQRAALLEAGGNIYGAFAGACEKNTKGARGWLLGWDAAKLSPLAKQQLTNQVLPANSPNDFFLTSIWMSGYGPSSGLTGNVFFVTGNSDPSGTTYDKRRAINLSESVVEWSPALGKVASYFSPTDPGADVATLDRGDLDFGAEGVMLLPQQPGSVPHLAVAAGKAGIMYLMNQDHLGGEDSSNALGEFMVGGCWCGPSYFDGSDGVGRVVSSGGKSVMLWEVQSSSATTLVPDPSFKSPSISTGQNLGFFTSISSNGTAAGSAVIWAVNRPFNATMDVTLYAFDAATGKQLFAATAGTWPKTRDANIVPTVANGKVYVASDKMLAIFGIKEAGHSLAWRAKTKRTNMAYSYLLQNKSDSAH